MKAIIQRNLPLTVKYNLIDKQYISLMDGGWCCENCGKPIANIAKVKNETNETYYIGFDCLETLLINNNLLDGKSIGEYKQFKKHLPTFIKHAKAINDVCKKSNINTLLFEASKFNEWKSLGNSTFLTYYYVSQNGKKYNEIVRLKNEVNVDDFINVVQSITGANITTE